MRRLNGIAELERAVGQELGVGSWYQVTQPAITAFADVTGDHQWIHIDTARAAEGPYGATIAHGYFSLSLLPRLVKDAFEFSGFSMKVNYGLDRVRFPSAVRVDSRIRARAVLTEVEITSRGARVVVRNTVEIEGTDAPACVADTVSLLIS
ncbi:MaoC family dehydratase [Diaminobutyricimonas sp. TR449]|uniref:MaoC family dehydratase n=1 Tax=Diaminobutyricimonas sp. TR449 TaxID=2708076 RepID=UPI001422CAAE|nr:MaoC family dehydratase [Diaminobutyricimonas sp. TR449]